MSISCENAVYEATLRYFQIDLPRPANLGRMCEIGANRAMPDLVNMQQMIMELLQDQRKNCLVPPPTPPPQSRISVRIMLISHFHACDMTARWIMC